MATNNSNHICRVKDAFLEGKKLWPGVVSPSLVRSWDRTVKAGIRRTEKLLFDCGTSVQDARHIAAASAVFTGAASQDLVDLAASLKVSDWVVLLTDAQGTILDSVARNRPSRRFGSDPLGVGRRLPESSIGTTAPGVVINELIPFSVQRHEHYLDELSHLSCVAAPVFGFDRELLGVLNVTAYDSLINAHTWQRVNMTAMSIENRVFECSAIGEVFAIHEDHRMLGTPFQGLVATLEDGRVTAANTMARQMLGLVEHATEPYFVSDLFDTAFPLIHRRSGTSGAVEQIQTR